MVNSAIVCTVRGQVGLFFPELTVRLLYFKNEFEIFQLSICRNLHSLRQDRVPKDWIPEQQILRFRFWGRCMNVDIYNFRSFRKSQVPDGFPALFRHLSRYGKMEGRAGKATYFYSKASHCLFKCFNQS